MIIIPIRIQFAYSPTIFILLFIHLGYHIIQMSLGLYLMECSRGVMHKAFDYAQTD